MPHPDLVDVAPVEERRPLTLDDGAAEPCDEPVDRRPVEGQALAPEGTFVRYDGEGRPPVTDGPFAETKDLIAGWYVIDVDSHERAVELAGELSAAPGAGGTPLEEWIEVRPFLTVPPAITE